MNRTYKATVTLDWESLAELIVWAAKHNCAGGLSFSTSTDEKHNCAGGLSFSTTITDDDVGMVEVAEAKAALAITADLPRKRKAAKRRQDMKLNQHRRAERDKRYIMRLGKVDIDASIEALGLSREELVNKQCKGGSTEHRVKCAILKESAHLAAKRPTVAEQQEWYAQKLNEAHAAASRPPVAKVKPLPLVRKPSGSIDIDGSLLSLGLSRATILRHKWRQGSNPHKVKAAIRCNWKAALKARLPEPYQSHHNSSGTILGEAKMKEHGLKDLSHVA